MSCVDVRDVVAVQQELEVRGRVSNFSHCSLIKVLTDPPYLLRAACTLKVNTIDHIDLWVTHSK